MKKTIFGIMFAMIVGMVACTNGTTGTTTGVDSTAVDSTVVDSTVVVDDAVVDTLGIAAVDTLSAE